MSLNNLQLPSQIFFNPKDTWWEFVALDPWMRWKRYWDVGAGMGHLTEGMNGMKRECVGLDTHTRAGQSLLVQIADVLAYHFTPDDCLLIARPCHGPWLETLLRRSVGQAEVLYIGLERNLEQDLHGFHHEIIAEDVGEDGENVHRVIGRVDELERWCLLETSGSEEPYWMMEDLLAHRWVNHTGGGFPKGKGDVKILEERLLSSFYQLKRTREEVCSKDPEVRGGWITPEGEWLPGTSTSHAEILVQVFGITEARAEEIGFVRCYGEDSDHHYYFLKEGCTLTKLQIVALRKLGFDLRRDLQTTRGVL